MFCLQELQTAKMKLVCGNMLVAFLNSDGSGKIIVDVSQFQRQRNESDCGLFAVAAMVALAHGSDPSKLFLALSFILITNVLFTRITNCQNETFLW
jgi:hypothetical protein